EGRVAAVPGMLVTGAGRVTRDRARRDLVLVAALVATDVDISGIMKARHSRSEARRFATVQARQRCALASETPPAAHRLDRSVAPAGGVERSPLPGNWAQIRPARSGDDRADEGSDGMSTVKLGDIELYYEERGNGDPLLLIMGLAADSTAWMFQLPEFSQRY